MSDPPTHPTSPDDADDLSPLTEHALTATRLAKLSELQAAGVDPYPVRFERTARSIELHERFADLEPASSTGTDEVVAGRVLLVRSFGKLVFATVDDGAGKIQLMIRRNRLDDSGLAVLDQLDAGDWVGGSGEIVTTKRGELSVDLTDLVLLAKGLRPLPDKFHGLQDVERRSRQRYLDLMMNQESRRVALIRAEVVSELRRQFEARDYIEVETPVLLTEAGGALARPFETHHNALGLDMYLRIATELHLKRLVVGGLERVFEIGRIFRNEGIDATHNPEFTTLESYEALADYHDIMRLVEEVVEAVAERALGTPVITRRGKELSLVGPYRRVRLVEAVAEAVGHPVWPPIPLDEMRDLARRHGVETEPTWRYGKIIDELFELLVQHTIWEPTYITDHPADISPLAREHRDDPGLTERFELFIAGGEYANAFSELNDPIAQRDRFTEQAKARADGDEEAHPVDEDFLRALEYGMPPTGGLGIGVDRLVMLLADQTHIREVILFPAMRPEDR